MSNFIKWLATCLCLLTISETTFSNGISPATEQTILGAWGRHGDLGSFEEFLLEKTAGTHTFSSWLHHRPELLTDSWQLENCRIIITPQHEKLGPFRFEIIEAGRNRLKLYDEFSHHEAIYLRLSGKP